MLINLEKGNPQWEFCPLPVRSFCTLEVDVSKSDDPQAAILKAIAKKNIEDAVVRLIYKLRSEQLDQIDTSSLHQALSIAHTYTIQPELVSQLARPRVPELGSSASTDPLEALKTYLDNRDDLKDIATAMMEVAQSLLDGDQEAWLEASGVEEGGQMPLANADGQLRLL